MKSVAILGSTGSIGVSTLDVIGSHRGELEVAGLAAGRNVGLLAEQIERFRPRVASVADPRDLQRLRELLGAKAAGVELLAGPEGARDVACHPDASFVMTAMVGAVGLEPTIAAIRRGITVGIANKEPLVAAGRLCTSEARRAGATLLPVDSEHSAIFQCLAGAGSGGERSVARLLLTCSGGPFREVSDLAAVTREQALKHPTWSMGSKITIDSATLMNKGLELIEARWLFSVPVERIEVVIHPQSVIHSMVEFADGSVLAQLGTPDMRGPIAYALGYPERLALEVPRLDFSRLSSLDFEAPDRERFPALDLARAAIDSGGTAPAVLNAANEVAVAAFLDERIPFLQISELVARTLDAHRPERDDDLEAILAADSWGRATAERLVGQLGA